MMKGKVDALKSEIKIKTKDKIEIQTRVSTRAHNKSELESNFKTFEKQQEQKDMREKVLKDKLREACKVQETYKRILERLREERSQFDAYIKNLQKSHSSKNND